MTYEQGDAQTHPFARGHYDVAISRFGAMFFPDPSDDRRPLLARRPHPTKRMLERANFCGVSFDDVHEPVFNGHVIETALAFVRSRRSTCDALARLDHHRPPPPTEQETNMNSDIATRTTVRLDDGAQLCVEAIGDANDPALLLIGGATWSMDWWEDDLCRRLADRGRLVVRYDQRDTGRSTSYPPGSPGYTSADQVTDALAVLDALGIGRANVVGLSMGGFIAQRLALEHRDRITTLTLMSTSPVDPAIEGLPAPAPQIQATFTDQSPEPDWNDRDAVVEHIIEAERPYAGPGNFDESRLQAIAGRVFDRTNDIAASLTNHFILEDGAPADTQLNQLRGLPTLVLHGTADPMFPPAHGKALADAIPGARLVELDDVGHQLPPPHLWPRLIDTLIDHTEKT